MANKVEKDEVTGVETTGHEWDGIKELNNPLPRWWVIVFYASIAFAVLWWVLYPSWPTLTGYWKGVLGSNQRLALEEQLTKARAAQAAWLEKIATLDTAAVAADPELLSFAMRGGEVAFKENCAACHGLGGAGQFNYPTLADDDWLWGGTLADIEQTVRHGIRFYDDPDTRDSQMPAFGADENPRSPAPDRQPHRQRAWPLPLPPAVPEPASGPSGLSPPSPQPPPPRPPARQPGYPGSAHRSALLPRQRPASCAEPRCRDCPARAAARADRLQHRRGHETPRSPPPTCSPEAE